MNLVYFETLIAQDEIIENADPDIKKELVKESLKKFKAKKTNLTAIALDHLVPSCLIMGRVLRLTSNKKNKNLLLSDTEVVNFLDNGVVTDEQVIEKIVSLAESE